MVIFLQQKRKENKQIGYNNREETYMMIFLSQVFYNIHGPFQKKNNYIISKALFLNHIYLRFLGEI